MHRTHADMRTPAFPRDAKARRVVAGYDAGWEQGWEQGWHVDTEELLQPLRATLGGVS